MDTKTSKKSSEVVQSSILKSGKKTYFFDIKLSANKTKYLKVTESTFEGEGKPRRYNSFLMFPETVENFQQKLSEIAQLLAA